MSSLLRTSRLLARLALGGLLLGAVTAPEVAWAQGAPVFDAAVIELVTPTALVGDGATAADVYILALNADGSPIAGFKSKPTVSAGSATDLVDAGGGLYRFTYTPSKVDAVTSVTVGVKGKVGKDAVQRSWSFVVSPPRSHQISIATNPAQLVLGQDTTASVAINLAGGDRQNLTGVELSVRPSTGAVDNIIPLGGGQFSALFTAPTVKYPHVALLTVVDRRDPGHTYTGVAVPLVGKADYPVTVTPNARVILKVGGRDFGPIASDAMGRAVVPIIVPPGTQSATRVQIAPDGKVTEDVLDLKIPEARRIALFPSASAIPSDGRLQVPVRAYVVTADGKPDPAANVVFSTTAGVVSPAKHEANGVYVAMYTPPFGNTATQATIAVNLADKPSLQADSLTINLVPTRASKVTLTAEPTTLPAGADGFKVFAKATGPDGTGLGGRTLNIASNGARLKEPVKDLRNGDYQALFATTSGGPVELSASIASPPTGNPLARVLLVPGKERLAADGTSTASVTVATVDEYGYAVPNQQVALRVSQGDGTMPTQTTTNADGIAQVFYTAGRKNGVVALGATVGDLSASTTLIQAPNTLALPDLPVSGTKEVSALTNEWAGGLAALRVEREGMAGAAVAASTAVAVPLPTAAVPKMGLTSDPATVSAGGTVIIKVTVQDANGRGVGGQQLDFLTSAGTVGAVTDLGNGNYQATLSVPQGTTGEVKVSAASRDGSLSAFMRVPVGGADAAWGSNPFAPTTTSPFTTTTTTQPTTTQPTTTQPTTTAPTMGTTTAPTNTTTTTTTKVVPPAGDHWNLRVRGGFTYAGYTYSEQVLTQATVLYPSPINLGAGTTGFNAEARGWLPMFRYIGADVSVRGGVYSFAPQPLCTKLSQIRGEDLSCDSAGPVSDWLFDVNALVAARYPFQVGSAEFWVGARVGYSMSDMQAYKVVTNTIDPEPLYISSLALGPEVGVDIGKNVFLHTYFLEHLASGTSPYNTQFGVDGGYVFGKGGFAPFVSAAYDFGVRKLEVLNEPGATVGQLDDSQHSVSVSVGIQL